MITRFFDANGSLVLPLDRDASSRFLPWLIAPQTLLCVIALATAFILNNLTSRWERDVSGAMTVEIAFPVAASAEAEKKMRDYVETALGVLSSTPGVESARALSQDEMIDLLSPWLGDSDLLREMPLPVLIDVELSADRKPDLDRLAADLKQEVPGISVDDHRVWLSKLINLSRSVEWLAIIITILIGGATSLTVMFAIRTGMAIHQEVIRILHLIGATDDYIAREFANRTFVLALKGALIGFIPAVPLLIALAGFGGYMEGGFFAKLTMPWEGWAMVVATPVAAALLAMATARITVRRKLSGMV